MSSGKKTTLAEAICGHLQLEALFRTSSGNQTLKSWPSNHGCFLRSSFAWEGGSY